MSSAEGRGSARGGRRPGGRGRGRGAAAAANRPPGGTNTSSSSSAPATTTTSSSKKSDSTNNKNSSSSSTNPNRSGAGGGGGSNSNRNRSQPHSSAANKPTVPVSTPPATAGGAPSTSQQPTSKKDPSSNNNNKPPQPQSKKAAAAAAKSGASRKQQQQQQQPDPPSAVPVSTAAAVEDAQKQQRAAALEKRRAAREKERSHRTAAVREAMQLLQSVQEQATMHATNRQLLGVPEHLKQARAAFDQRKKTLKSDLKKCTAFCKKIKVGTLYSSKDALSDGGAPLRHELNTLNLSRYVEEVVAALLESKPKVNDLPIMSILCQAMHTNYPEFLPNLLPSIWGVVLQEPSVKKKLVDDLTPSELSKLRRLYVRLLTDFLLNGLLPSSDVQKLVKHVFEWTGAAHHYAVQDAVAVVSFGRAATFEILGRVSATIHDALQLIHKEYETLERVEQQPQQPSDMDVETQESVAGPATTSTMTNASMDENDNVDDTPVVLSRALLDEAMTVAAQVEQLVREQRALPAETVESLAQHCLGACQTLSTSLVQTHAKLQKLEKRCDQDRLLSGTLTAGREKGLAEARQLLDSLQKSVEALSDSLNQPVPQLVAEQDDDAGERGMGVEVWTKDASALGEEHLGPFDDEETRVFYCDIPDLLTTVPPALLGLSEEEIEKRKEANAKKYGGVAGEEPPVVDDAAPDVTPTSAAQLDADEEGKGGLSEEEDGEEEENKDTPHYRLMLLLDQELPECHSREQIDEITEKFCTNFGSAKKSRKRLLKTLFLVPRSRLDLLPYYSRVTTTLDRVYSDFASSLVTELEQQFHGQAKFKKNQNLEGRMRTCRYIGELTKFGAAPPIVALRCLQRCIEDFTGSNVDVACVLLETCGRFLYRLKHTTKRLTTLMETMTRLSKAKNLDERLQSLVKAAFYSVKPPQSGPRKRAKEYPPLEAYLRHLLLVRLDPTEASISLVTKQLVRLPWDDPSQQCGALITRIMLKACRKGRYRTIEAIATVSSKLRAQRAAGEVTVRLIDAVIEELRWALESPNFRDQQRIITYARLLGEMYSTSSQVSGQVVLDMLYEFINVGHEIPDSLREASKKLAAEAAAAAAESNSATKLPVYNSASGVSQAIQEDEEMEESELETKEEDTAPAPVAVSQYSKYDPRVPSSRDPANSSYRITLVCTLLEVVAKSLVSKNNLPRLSGFLAAFQRYLFTKTMLPTDVEFALLDTFDIIDSQWKRMTKGGGGNLTRATTGDATRGTTADAGFPRYVTWLEAHNATVAVEESEAVFEAQKRARLEALSDESKSLSDIHDDHLSMNDDEMASLMDEGDDEDVSTVRSGGSEDGGGDFEENEIEATAEDDEGRSWVSEEEDEEVSGEDDSEGEFDENEEDEFDEEAYMQQLELEAFERELRRITMDALEKGKSASRKQVGDTMISGSQIVKKKPEPGESSLLAGSMALGGGAGISFQVLRKGNKGKVEARELVVPVDTNLAMVATKQDDAKARERDEIKQRVLTYELQSAEAEGTGGNVYLEQDKLQRNRNKALSMDTIDKNFGTTRGDLHPSQVTKKPVVAPVTATGRGRGTTAARGVVVSGSGGRGGTGRGRGGRSNASGRILF